MTVDEMLTVIRRALDAAEAGDVEAYLACLSDDAVLETPYANADGGLSHPRPAIAGLVGFVAKTFATRSFTIDRAFTSQDGTALAVEYHSEMRSRVGDVGYNNRYVGVFEFRDGLVSLWREYANPLTFAAAMAAINERS